MTAVGDGQQAMRPHPRRSARHRPGRRRHAEARRLRGRRVHQERPGARAHPGAAAHGGVRAGGRGPRPRRPLRRRPGQAVRAAGADWPREGTARPAGRRRRPTPVESRDDRRPTSRRAPESGAAAGATCRWSFRRWSAGRTGAGQPETSLDDYFDRLDAAFAHLTGAPPGPRRWRPRSRRSRRSRRPGASSAAPPARAAACRCPTRSRPCSTPSRRSAPERACAAASRGRVAAAAGGAGDR